MQSKKSKKTNQKATDEPRISPEIVVSVVPVEKAAAPRKRAVKGAAGEQSPAKPRASRATKHHAAKPVIAPPALAMAASAGAGNSVTTVVAPAAEAATPKPALITEERIAELAYSYWAERGYQGGNPHEDWFRAEEELRLLTW